MTWQKSLDHYSCCKALQKKKKKTWSSAAQQFKTTSCQRLSKCVFSRSAESCSVLHDQVTTGELANWRVSRPSANKSVCKWLTTLPSAFVVSSYKFSSKLVDGKQSYCEIQQVAADSILVKYKLKLMQVCFYEINSATTLWIRTHFCQ